MKSTKLDEFLQDVKEEEFTIKDKAYVAKYNGKVILKLTSVYQNNDIPLDEQVLAMMELVFGKKESNEILDQLGYKGIELLAKSITAGLGLDSPS